VPIRPTDSALFLVNPGWCEAPAIAHRGISRFRVRCFASPLHDSEHTSAISRRETPELCRIRSPRKQGRRECRTLGASAAACAVVESTRVSHHGHAGNVRHSPRDGVNGCSALSPVTGLVCHRRLWSLLHKLDASVGASGPHGFAVRFSAVRQRHIRVHRIPHPTSVTIAIRPSLWVRDGEHMQVIWVRRKTEYFCKGDWTGKSVICPSGALPAHTYEILISWDLPSSRFQMTFWPPWEGGYAIAAALHMR